MSEGTEIILQMPHILPLIGAFVTSTAYALLLSTKIGRRWADEQTWATVVAGSALTLGWLAVDSPKSAVTALVFFAVTGIPIIVRSLWIQLQSLEHAYHKAMKDE